jgi:hypothetical protein
LPLIVLLIAAQLASASPSGEPAVAGKADFRILNQLNPCSRPASTDEIVVCGRRGEDDRYRIPEALRDEGGSGQVSGDGRALLDAQPFAPCGIFAGQRQCSKAEAAEFGYGRGRDPITVVGKIIAEIADPE